MPSSHPVAPDELLARLRQFQSDYFPLHQQRFQDLVAQGQQPNISLKALLKWLRLL